MNDKQELSELLTAKANEFTVHLHPNPVPAQERDRIKASPKFGTVFSDHMASISWNTDAGWHDRKVIPYGPLTLQPAAAVLHYAQEIFEGLKAYRHDDGSVWSFRPEANAARFARSARRLALPELSELDFLGSLKALVEVDNAWVPQGEESSLYLRPFMFASESFLGVRPAQGVDYYVIASPVGAYFSSGVKPVSIWVAEEYHRAGDGGTGAAKCGGNYAASLLPQTEAYENGCDQVCFLDASTNTYVEELGGMNVFFVYSNGTVTTPELSGSILEGVTRSSIIQLLKDTGKNVVERKIALSEVKESLENGEIIEIFACGTAAVVTPIGNLKGNSFDLAVADGQAGELTLQIREELTGIQTGHLPDRYNWLTQLA